MVALCALALASVGTLQTAQAETTDPTDPTILVITKEQEAIKLCDYLIKNRDNLAVVDLFSFKYKGKTYKSIQYSNMLFTRTKAGGKLVLPPKYDKKYSIHVADWNFEKLGVEVGQRVRATTLGQLPLDVDWLRLSFDSRVPLLGKTKINFCHIEAPNQTLADYVYSLY